MQIAPNLIQLYKKLNDSLQEYEIPMYFVQGPPGSSIGNGLKWKSILSALKYAIFTSVECPIITFIYWIAKILQS